MIIIWRLFENSRCLRSHRWNDQKWIMGLGCVSVCVGWDGAGLGRGWFLTPDSLTQVFTHPARGGPATRCFGFCGQWSKFLPEGWRPSPNPWATLLFINSTTARDQPAARAVMWTRDLKCASSSALCVTKASHTNTWCTSWNNQKLSLYNQKGLLIWPSKKVSGCTWFISTHDLKWQNVLFFNKKTF